MTDGDSPIPSESAFRTELAGLIGRALASGVDVKGGWECRSDDMRSDYDVVITEVRSGGSTGATESTGAAGADEDD